MIIFHIVYKRMLSQSHHANKSHTSSMESMGSSSTLALLCTCYVTYTLLHQRRVRQDSDCTFCHEPETVEHCLLQCKRYKKLRASCKSALQAINQPLNLATVLGNTTALSSAE